MCIFSHIIYLMGNVNSFPSSGPHDGLKGIPLGEENCAQIKLFTPIEVKPSPYIILFWTFYIYL